VLLLLSSVVLAPLVAYLLSDRTLPMAEKSIYSFTVKDIHDKDYDFAQLKGKVLLVVNVASRCGFTKQYKNLETLYKKYQDRGFLIIGFPCNQFGSQEPGTNAEIEAFACGEYHATFPLMSKVDVNGGNEHPLYNYLKNERKGFLGTGFIKWNFTKFLVNRKGVPVKRYSPNDLPESFEKDIEALLNEKEEK